MNAVKTRRKIRSRASFINTKTELEINLSSALSHAHNLFESSFSSLPFIYFSLCLCYALWFFSFSFSVLKTREKIQLKIWISNNSQTPSSLMTKYLEFTKYFQLRNKWTIYICAQHKYDQFSYHVFPIIIRYNYKYFSQHICIL